MTNPTSNFGWQMPTSTDLVTDLPADFEVFGQAVDTSLADLKGGTTGQVLKKNSNTDMDFVWSADSAGMTNPMTTTGDTIYSSSGSTPARLGIGTAGQFLKVNAGATAPEWATLTTSPTSFTLLANGTSLVGSASTTINVTTRETYIILLKNFSANGTAQFQLRINGDSAGNYYWFGGYYTGSTASETGINGTTQYVLGTQATAAASEGRGGIYVTGGSSTGAKIIHSNFVAGDTGSRLSVAYGAYAGSAAITSFTFISDNGNFDSGNVYIFGGQ